MKVIDLQVQIATRKGSPFSPEDIAKFETYFGRKLRYDQTEAEFAAYLKGTGVKAMLVTPTLSLRDLGKIREINDYAFELKRTCPDVIIGAWACISPRLGIDAVRELERCIKDLKVIGYYTSGVSTGVAVNDKSYYRLYHLCAEAGIPVKVNIGHTADGAGQPGGRGVHLFTERPIPHLDDIAADFPDLTVISAHCPWPFHEEMISILVHKTNVFSELHGWSPKYFPPEIKREVNGRLQDRFMFASDYPFLTHERLFGDWQAEGYKPEVLEKVYYKNAERVFKLG